MSELPWMVEARQLAAQCWCDPETKDREMDVALAEAVARRIRTCLEAAAEYRSKVEHYREMVGNISLRRDKVMTVGFKSEHWPDANGNPEGGTTFGNGFAIGWQHGPLGRGGDRKEPNGAFVEDVIGACADRIRYYQDGRFNSEYNAKALDHLEAALAALNQRTKDREARDVEGTHKD